MIIFYQVQEAYPLQIYEDITRVLFLFNAGIFSRAELILAVTMLLRDYPELSEWLKNYIDPTTCTPLKSSVRTLEHETDNRRTILSAKRKEVFDILELGKFTLSLIR